MMEANTSSQTNSNGINKKLIPFYNLICNQDFQKKLLPLDVVIFTAQHDLHQATRKIFRLFVNFSASDWPAAFWLTS